VQVSSVKARLAEPDFGYVRITHFSETTAADLDRAVAQLIAENGRKLAGLVLDLRDNPGGLLDAGVAVADAFLDAGLIVTAEGRAPDARFSLSAKKGDLIDGAPLTVLVNGDSASASEIVAGALRDHRRATLVGQQTYGKGSVQTVVPLSSGYALKLTTSRYYTPSGESIHKTGITPDVIIDSQQTASTASGDPDSDYALRVALETTKQAVQPGLALAASQAGRP
jgi:carboxyl-terminal processing protease